MLIVACVFSWLVSAVLILKAALSWRLQLSGRAEPAAPGPEVAVPAAPGPEWPPGSLVRKGARRAHVPQAILGVGIAVMLTAGLALQGDGPMKTLPVLVAAAGMGMMSVAYVSAFSVIWFNRPKFVVPPHLRDETGVLAEWRRNRRGTRGEER